MGKPMAHSKKALDHYDKVDAPRVDWLFEQATTDAEVHAAVRAEEESILKVRKAFFEDTKGINSLSNCMIVTLDFVRKCVANAK